MSIKLDTSLHEFVKIKSFPSPNLFLDWGRFT